MHQEKMVAQEISQDHEKQNIQTVVEWFRLNRNADLVDFLILVQITNSFSQIRSFLIISSDLKLILSHLICGILNKIKQIKLNLCRVLPARMWYYQYECSTIRMNVVLPV